MPITNKQGRPRYSKKDLRKMKVADDEKKLAKEVKKAEKKNRQKKRPSTANAQGGGVPMSKKINRPRYVDGILQQK